MMNLSIVLAFSSRIQHVKMLSMELIMMTQTIPVIAQAVHQALVVEIIARLSIH